MIHHLRLKIDRLAFISLLGLAVFVAVSPALTEIFSTVAVICFLFSLTGERQRGFLKRYPRPLLASFAGLCAWLTFASLASQAPLESFSALVTKWGQWLLTGVAAAGTLRTSRRMHVFLWALLAGSFLVVTDGIWQHVFGTDFLRGNPLKAGLYPTGPLPHHTLFAAYLMVFMLLGIGMNLTPSLPKPVRLLLSAHHLLFFVCLVLTFSRGAWIGAAVGLAGLLLLCGRQILLPAIVLVLAVFLFSPSRLTFRFDEKPFSPNFGGYRTQIWNSSKVMIREHPFKGVGINRFHQEIGAYSTKRGYAHNSYLQFTAETGIPGLTLFAGFLLGLLGLGFHQLRSHAPPFQAAGYGLLFALIGFSIHAGVDNHFYNASLAMLFWLLLGTLLSLIYLRPENTDEAPGYQQGFDPAMELKKKEKKVARK